MDTRQTFRKPFVKNTVRVVISLVLTLALAAACLWLHYRVGIGLLPDGYGIYNYAAALLCGVILCPIATLWLQLEHCVGSTRFNYARISLLIQAAIAAFLALGFFFSRGAAAQPY